MVEYNTPQDVAKALEADQTRRIEALANEKLGLPYKQRVDKELADLGHGSVDEFEELQARVQELELTLRFFRQVNNAARDKLSLWLNSRVEGLAAEAYQQVRETRNALADALHRTKKV